MQRIVSLYKIFFMEILSSTVLINDKRNYEKGIFAFLLSFISLGLILFLLSCTKKDFSPPPVAYVSFSVNGSSYNWVEQKTSSAGDNMAIGIYKFMAGPQKGKYYFHASSAFGSLSPPGKKVFLSTETSTLTPNTSFTYALTSTFTSTFTSGLAPHEVIATNVNIAYYTQTIFKATEIGDFATITFTRIEGKRADGTFSAKLTRLSDSAKIDITNGIFKNVEVNVLVSA